MAALYHRPKRDASAGMTSTLEGNLAGSRGTAAEAAAGRTALPPSAARRFVVKDRAALRADLERVAATPDLRRVIVSHGAMLTEGAAATLRRVAAAV